MSVMVTFSADEPVWGLCGHCDEYLCRIHEMHVFECKCPAIEVWAEHNLDPYSDNTVPIGPDGKPIEMQEE